MYAWLLPRIGRRGAIVATTLWYVLLILLVTLLAAEPPADFRYDDL